MPHPHGTINRYNNQRCRCDLCRAAIRSYRREQRARLRRGPDDLNAVARNEIMTTARAYSARIPAETTLRSRASSQAGPAQARSRRARVDQSALFATCLRCGGQLSRSRHLYCEQCQDATPGHARETRRRRGRAIAATRAFCVTVVATTHVLRREPMIRSSCPRAIHRRRSTRKMPSGSLLAFFGTRTRSNGTTASMRSTREKRCARTVDTTSNRQNAPRTLSFRCGRPSTASWCVRTRRPSSPLSVASRLSKRRTDTGVLVEEGRLATDDGGTRRHARNVPPSRRDVLPPDGIGPEG